MQRRDRIARLKKRMLEQQIDAYIISSSDPHQSEYVAPHWSAREWISGFTGSAGIVIVTRDHAGLWTDSRYFLQAEQQLQGSGIELHQLITPHAPEHVLWLKEQLPPGSTIGCDGFLFSAAQIKRLENRLRENNTKIDHQLDFISDIWEERPPIPGNPIFEHELQYAGKSRKEKLEMVRTEMAARTADYYFVPTLDDIAWVLNIRGNDVAFNPVCICYLLIGAGLCRLFIDEKKVPEALLAKFAAEGIILHPYNGSADFLKNIPQNDSILADPGSVSIHLLNVIPAGQLIRGDNIIRSLKAIKNATELEHIRQAMLKDGVALTRLYRWLEAELQQRAVSEVEVARQLARFRRDQGDYYGESFAAIVGYKGNGAIVHYRPEEGSCASIKPEGILLLDSGGQYISGTTDITRTTALGKPTEEQKRHYTLVLKGHIAIATIQFPEGTRGMQLDTLARVHLWKNGLNYGHGTGHGVGFFLNVHEPPQGFATNPSTSRGTAIFKPGMFTSNEPGFYKTGEYGIRIENLILCVEGEETDFGKFLKFETITLFPISQTLIDPALLTPAEIDWLNDYHQMVFEKLSPLLNSEEVEWLAQKCRKLML